MILIDTGVFLARYLERDAQHAPAVFEKSADQRISFTDAVSIALMRSRKMREAFTFDRHFALADSAAPQPLVPSVSRGVGA